MPACSSAASHSSDGRGGGVVIDIDASLAPELRDMLVVAASGQTLRTTLDR